MQNWITIIFANKSVTDPNVRGGAISHCKANLLLCLVQQISPTLCDVIKDISNSKYDMNRFKHKNYEKIIDENRVCNKDTVFACNSETNAWD